VVSAPYTVEDKSGVETRALLRVIHGVAPWNNDVGYDCSGRYAVIGPAVSPEMASVVEQVEPGDIGVVDVVVDDGTGVDGHDRNARIVVEHVGGVVLEPAVGRGDSVDIVDIAVNDLIYWSTTWFCLMSIRICGPTTKTANINPVERCTMESE